MSFASRSSKSNVGLHCLFAAALAATVASVCTVASSKPALAHPAYQLFPEEEAPAEAPAVKVAKKTRHKQPAKLVDPSPSIDRSSTAHTSSKVASIEVQPVSEPGSSNLTGAGSRIKSMTGGFDTTLNQIPHHSQGYFRRAEAEARAREFKAAISDCELAIKLNPRYTEAFYLRGVARLATGDLSGALNDLDKVVIRDDNYPEVFYTRGEVREKQGDLHGAQVDWQTALKKAQESGDRRLQAKIKTRLKTNI
ncbi:MAG: hypothetical protein KGS72_14100 [Cyanobacteria bacterium REEB67]|nr:hypothetical protein [Cyanobacteria bacterium REEB67]